MAEISKQHLLWLGAVVAIVILAMAGWSHLRVRALRAELNTLAAESGELAQENEALLRERSSERQERGKIRSSGEAIALEVLRPDLPMTGTIYLDQEGGRALFEMEAPPATAEPGECYQLWLQGPNGESPTATFDLDASGTIELLLIGLPDSIEGAFVTPVDKPNERLLRTQPPS